MTEAAQAPKAAAGKTTSYVVLAQVSQAALLPGLHEEGEETDVTAFGGIKRWEEVGEVNAKTPLAARQAYAQTSGSTTALTLRAIPKRHWGEAQTLRPVTVTTFEAVAS